MPLSNVPAAMPAAEFTANLAKLDEIIASFAQYGFNITLTDTQIRELSVPADRMAQFVQNAHDAVAQFDSSIPADFPKDEFQAAFLTFDQASQLESRLDQLRTGAHFTSMLAGSRAKGFSDALYDLLGSMGKFNAAVASFVKEKLAPFYARTGNRTAPPAP